MMDGGVEDEDDGRLEASLKSLKAHPGVIASPDGGQPALDSTTT